VQKKALKNHHMMDLNSPQEFNVGIECVTVCKSQRPLLAQSGRKLKGQLTSKHLCFSLLLKLPEKSVLINLPRLSIPP